MHMSLIPIICIFLLFLELDGAPNINYICYVEPM